MKVKESLWTWNVILGDELMLGSNHLKEEAEVYLTKFQRMFPGKEFKLVNMAPERPSNVVDLMDALRRSFVK